MKLKARISSYFLTGLAATLPVVITFYIISVVFKMADGLLGQHLNNIIEDKVGFIIPGVGLLLSIALIFFIGVVATHFLGRTLFPLIGRWFVKLPFINVVYPPIKQIVNFLFSREEMMFKKVAIIEYPRKGMYAMGFITNEELNRINSKVGKELVCVFIAFTPTPLSGYITFVPKEDVTMLDITAEEAIKLVVSAGIVSPAIATRLEAEQEKDVKEQES